MTSSPVWENFVFHLWIFEEKKNSKSEWMLFSVTLTKQTKNDNPKKKKVFKDPLMEFIKQFSTYLSWRSSGLAGSWLWARPWPRPHWWLPRWSCMLAPGTSPPGRGWSGPPVWRTGGLEESTAGWSCRSPRRRDPTTTALSCHWSGPVWRTGAWAALELERRKQH